MPTSDSMNKKVNLLRAFLEEGRTLGFEIPPALFVKIDKASMETAKQNKLTVALIGGFSEGKTSIVAAWLGKQLPGMKINAGESSDKVEIYDASAHLRIVDTPGLYGHKSDNSHIKEIKYKDITRRYVSEANIVLYVMNGPNPLKDSHKEELNRLFRDLDLLPRTVFVLGRFDEVADMEDDAEYDKMLEIKRQNVTERLCALIGLTDDEAKNLSIVGVSGNPYGRGLEHWNVHPEEFVKFSHIDSLRQAIDRKVDALGGITKVLAATQWSILIDVLSQPLRLAEEQKFIMESDVRRLGECVTSGQEDVEHIARHIKEARTVLRREIDAIFNAAIGAIQASTKDTLPDVLLKYVGPNNSIIEKALHDIYAEAIAPVSDNIRNVTRSFETALGRFSAMQHAEENASYEHLVVTGRCTPPEMVDDWFASLTGLLNKSMSLSATVGNATGVFGEIGTLLASWIATPSKAGQGSVSFWEWLAGPSAAKVAANTRATEVAAKNMTRLLSVAGIFVNIGVTVLSERQAQAAQAEFKKAKNILCEQLESSRKEIAHSLSLSDFSSKFLPEFEKFNIIIAQVNDELTRKKELFQRCDTWFRHAIELRKTLEA